MIRLRLKGFAPHGKMVSPVFDLADPEGAGIAQRVDIRSVRLTHEKEAPRERASISRCDRDPRRLFRPENGLPGRPKRLSRVPVVLFNGALC